MTALHDVPVVPLQTSPTAHPTACPTWCREEHTEAACEMLQTTMHQSLSHALTNPQPLAGYPNHLLQAQLTQFDQRREAGWTRLYVAGSGDVELNADEADIFIANAQAFIDTLRVLRRQMG